MTYDIEYTDTFGGEANYCWVKRAKAKMGLTGVRGKRFDHGDMIEFRPYRSCTVLFVTYRD